MDKLSADKYRENCQDAVSVIHNMVPRDPDWWESYEEAAEAHRQARVGAAAGGGGGHGAPLPTDHVGAASGFQAGGSDTDSDDICEIVGVTPGL
jgi:hypothetical protein